MFDLGAYETTTQTFRDAPLAPHRGLQADDAVSVPRALAAFCVLLYRYTGDEEPRVRVSRVGPDGETIASADVACALHGGMTLAAAVDETTSALLGDATLCDWQEVASDESLVLHWLSSPSTRTSTSEPSLALALRGDELHVAR